MAEASGHGQAERPELGGFGPGGFGFFAPIPHSEEGPPIAFWGGQRPACPLATGGGVAPNPGGEWEGYQDDASPLTPPAREPAEQPAEQSYTQEEVRAWIMRPLR